MALVLIVATNGLAVSGEGVSSGGVTTVAAQAENHAMHGMPGQGYMSAAEQQFYQEQEKQKATANGQGDVQYQPAGVALLENLENRLDQEIENPISLSIFFKYLGNIPTRQTPN